MFKHSGKSIQGVAVAYFIVSLLVGLLVAILIPYNMYMQSYGYISQGVLVTVGFILFAVIVFLSWVSALMIFAFGKIAESQETFLEALQDGVFGGNRAAGSDHAAGGTPQTKKIVANTMPWQDRIDGNKIICRHCLTKNSLDAVYCRKCGKNLRDA